MKLVEKTAADVEPNDFVYCEGHDGFHRVTGGLRHADTGWQLDLSDGSAYPVTPGERVFVRPWN